MLDRVGLSRGVLVQPVAHGTDCGALLHALADDPERLRGIALLNASVSDLQLMTLDRTGVRGARFSLPPPGYEVGAVGFDVLDVLVPKLLKMEWHAQIWAPLAELPPIVSRFARRGLTLVIDHMGAPDATRGVDDPNFKALLRWLETGRVWLKLIGYRLSQRYPDYEDIAPFHRALIDANPERVIWGSDWPHVHMREHMPDDGHLLDLLYEWSGSEAYRRILVDNPTQLYGF